MKRFGLILLVVVLCGGGALWAQEPAEEQVLRLAFDAADLKTLDPHFAAATMDRGVVDMIFNGLVRYRPGDINPDYIEPDLAESWEVSEDGLVWTFHLRQGVYFHPFPGHPEGYELTAEDVVYSLEKSADPARSAYAGEYAGMEFIAVDPLTVQIRLEQALSPGLFLPKVVDYAGGFIVCKRALEENGDEWFRTHPVGTGPFMFSSYTPMDRVVLVRNERYFQGAPILERVEVRYMPDVSARELGLRRGELDLVEGLREQPWVEKMEAVPGIVVDTFGPGETHVFHINMTQPPLDDLRVRQAIAYAISRDELVAFLGPRVCEPQYSAVPYQYLSGGLTPEELAERGLLYSVDRDKARELLAAAGYPNGFRIQAIITEMASYRRPTEAVQAQLREVGIDMQLQVVDHSTFHSLIREDASPLVMYEAWRPNADVFLTRFYHSDSIVVIGKRPDTNFSHYYQIDFPIEQARAELAPEVQAAWWKEAQIRILEDMAAHPLFVLKYVFARQPYVEYGYELRSCIALYPPINETTRILAH